MPSTETLLLVLLATGLLFVLLLMAAILWVVLTILFQIRRTIKHAKRMGTAKGLKALARKRGTWTTLGLGALAWLVGDRIKD